MKQDKKNAAPDHTAVRVALWRALHVQTDPPPHIIEDEIGFRLVAPDAAWRNRPDMDPDATKWFRASIVARARFVEDLVIEQVGQGVGQYIILGAGLDSFAQRRAAMAAKLHIFEIDQPGTQAWKKQRLLELGFGTPEWLRFVPVDFEAGSSWWEQLKRAGFDTSSPAIVACTGVSMYLTRDAIMATLRRIAALPPGSTLAMTFILPKKLTKTENRPMQQASEKGARAAGTPFISFFTPQEMLDLGQEAGFKKITHVSADDLAKRYFAGRTDHLSPANGEEFLIATT